MTTAADIIRLALKDCGAYGQGQIIPDEAMNDALTRLNMMIAQWARKRWLVYSLIDVTITSTGAVSYSIGAGGDFNTPRPDRLEDGCFIRQLNTGIAQWVDYPVQLIQSREDYSRIKLKTMGTFPAVVFYDSAFPLGNVYFWPVPQSAIYELHLLLKTPLSGFSNLATAMNLPPEYEAAIQYNLQTRLRAAFRMPPDPIIIGLAKDALETIRGANFQIGTLRMPRAVVGGQAGYNVYSDTP